jgi:predicted DNA-binding transcriptional regulator AlpA
MLTAVELLGFADLVRQLRVSRTRVEQLILTADFPEPHYVGAKRTRVWDRDDIEEWAAKKGRELHRDLDTPPEGIEV